MNSFAFWLGAFVVLLFAIITYGLMYHPVSTIITIVAIGVACAGFTWYANKYIHWQ